MEGSWQGFDEAISERVDRVAREVAVRTLVLRAFARAVLRARLEELDEEVARVAPAGLPDQVQAPHLLRWFGQLTLATRGAASHTPPPPSRLPSRPMLPLPLRLTPPPTPPLRLTPLPTPPFPLRLPPQP